MNRRGLFAAVFGFGAARSTASLAAPDLGAMGEELLVARVEAILAARAALEKAQEAAQAAVRQAERDRHHHLRLLEIQRWRAREDAMEPARSVFRCAAEEHFAGTPLAAIRVDLAVDRWREANNPPPPDSSFLSFELMSAEMSLSMCSDKTDYGDWRAISAKLAAKPLTMPISSASSAATCCGVVAEAGTASAAAVFPNTASLSAALLMSNSGTESSMDGVGMPILEAGGRSGNGSVAQPCGGLTAHHAACGEGEARQGLPVSVLSSTDQGTIALHGDDLDPGALCKSENSIPPAQNSAPAQGLSRGR